MDIYGDLTWRGLIHQCTDEPFLPGWLQGGRRTVYAGFDPTADSLHVGHFVPLMTLRRFQRAGHRPVALVGGATGMIGDPSGKSEERNLLSVDSLRANVVAIEKQMKSFLDFDCGETSAVLVNNFDWMRKFSYLDFLRDIGKNFPVNVMLGKDSVKSRLERTDTGLSYTEFSYMLLQAYDFVQLHDDHHCELQIGGSDQWGNITAGIDLARRMRSVQLYGITFPLLTKSDGQKMGKTERGAVWLSAERTSPYMFYQYWLNVSDDDAGNCLRVLTEVGREEIETLDESRRDDAHLRASQKRLAESLTELVHGAEGLAAAKKATDFFFGAEIRDCTDRQLLDIFADVPNTNVPLQQLSGDGLSFVDALAGAGMAKSKGEARRVIQQGGGYVNNRRIDDLDYRLSISDLASESVIVIRSGKKRFALVRAV